MDERRILMNVSFDLRKALGFRRLNLLVLAVILSLLGVVGSTVPAVAAEIIVDTGGVDDADCGAAGTPCRTIAYAVRDRAGSGDTVIVHAGTYPETIAMKSGVIISGTGTASTFIDGEGVRGPMVTANSGVAASAVFKGFTVRGGIAQNGGGVYIAATDSPVLTDIVVTNNTAVRGGGMYIAGSLTLTDTCFIGNAASVDGGGVYQGAVGGTITLVGGCLEQNTALGQVSSNGGGAYAAGNMVLSGTLVTDNSASRGGGGVFVSYIAVLTNATVLSNTAGQWGGGLYQNFFNDYTQITGGRFESNRTITTTDSSRGGGLFSSSRAIISGTQVISNSAVARGGGIYLATPSVLTNVLVISNTAGYGGGVYYTDHTSGVYTGAVRVYGGRIERNRATTADGGGLYSTKSMVLSDTVVLNNGAVRSGGGVYVAYTATLYQPQIIGNIAGDGGGLYQYQPVARIDVGGGTFEHNVATSSGGGLYVRGSGAFTQTTILTNTSGSDGGGLLVRLQALLHDVAVIGNQAGRSCGGLYQSQDDGGGAIILGGLFDSNVALAPSSTYYGGGGLCVFGETTITATQLTRNVSAGSGRGGGGLYAERGVRIVNALFAGNTATNGAGIYLRGSAGSRELLHLTIVSGTVGSGSAVYVYGGTTGITNTIIVSHTIGVFAANGAAAAIDGVLWSGNTANTGTAGTGHITVNHAHAAEPTFAVDGYHLTATSPAIDRGVDSNIAVDIDGETRPQSWLYDLGADEYVTTTQILTIAVAGTGHGVVTPTVGAHPYNDGITARLYATAASNSSFEGWSGDAGCETGAVSMAIGKTCTATFTMLEPSLSITTSVTPTTDVLYGSVVTYTVVLSNTGLGDDVNVVLTDTLPSALTFGRWLEQPVSGLSHSGNAITWTGSVLASTNITFTFTATRTGVAGDGYAVDDIVNTAYFSGTEQKGQASATFTVGSMVCGVGEGQSYTFAVQSGVAITITTLAGGLDCLYVDEIGVDHPSATGEIDSSGIKTGRYWLIRGLRDDKVTDVTGFTATLALPYTGLSDPRVCRYTRGAGYGWDCAADGFGDSTVWRSGITSFSEWAVGERVGPTAIALRQLTGRGGLQALGLLLALGALLILGTGVLGSSRLSTWVTHILRLRRTISS